jgi:hypothetical protein
MKEEVKLWPTQTHSSSSWGDLAENQRTWFIILVLPCITFVGLVSPLIFLNVHFLNWKIGIMIFSKAIYNTARIKWDNLNFINYSNPFYRNIKEKRTVWGKFHQVVHTSLMCTHILPCTLQHWGHKGHTHFKKEALYQHTMFICHYSLLNDEFLESFCGSCLL